MEEDQISKLRNILDRMFPDHTPGEILFELDYPVTLSPDWREVGIVALNYALHYRSEFTRELGELLEGVISDD